MILVASVEVRVVDSNGIVAAFRRGARFLTRDGRVLTVNDLIPGSRIVLRYDHGRRAVGIEV
jgi:uncharacterized protein (DUF1330 family)